MVGGVVSRMMDQLCKISLCPVAESFREMFFTPSPALSVRGIRNTPSPLPYTVSVRSPDIS
jgi:hypothetical protein